MLVGRTDECLYPESALSVPSIGKPSEITPEAAAVFEPDIIVTGPGQDLAGAVCIEPADMEHVYETIVSIAKLLDKTVEADLLVHDLRTTFERVKEKTSRFHMTRVHYEDEAGMRPAYLAAVVAFAGGELYAGNSTIESLRKFDPQVIIYSGDECYEERMVARDGWDGLNAVQRERILRIDAELLRPTPRLALGAKRLAKLLHGVEVNGNGN
jgi:iron complex transport system substrate-binding protein